MVMMEQAFWLILFLAVVGIAALIAAAMMWQKESIQQPGTPTGQRSYQEEYSAPDFTESAGFAVTMYPSTGYPDSGAVLAHQPQNGGD